MMSDGYETAKFGWSNNHGYEYWVGEIDDGVFGISYKEGGAAIAETVFEFSDTDADGIIAAMNKAIEHFRARQA